MTKTSQPWAVLAEAFRTSLGPQCIAYAFVATLLMVFVWRIVGGLVLPVLPQDSTHAVLPAEVKAVRHHAWLSSFSNPSNDDVGKPILFHVLPEDFRVAIQSHFGDSLPKNLVADTYFRLVEPVRQIFVTGQTWQTFAYYLFGSLLNVLVWSYFGCGITRTSVLRICNPEKPATPLESLRYACRHGFKIFSAVTLPLLGIALMALPIVVVGFLMRWDFGVALGAILWSIVTLVACLMAVMGIGLITGWPLLWGTICTEGSDAFDAISRSYAYSFQRPLKYLLYVAMALVLGTFGLLVAWCFAEMVVSLSFWSVELGSGAQHTEALRNQIAQSGSTITETKAGTTYRTGASIIAHTVWLVRCVAGAYSFSFFWSMAGAIYLLLRRDTDQTELDEVFCEADQANLGESPQSTATHPEL